MDVRGCSRVTYEISIDVLNVSSYAVTTIHDGSPDTIPISLPQTSFSPDRIADDSYDAELRLVYHGEENGTTVERTITSRNITVKVSE